MTILASSHLNLKDGLIPLADKLDEKNFSTWKKSVLLTLHTLKFQDHLSTSDKVPPQFEAIVIVEVESKSTAKIGGAEGEFIITTMKAPTSGPTILQESEKFTEWEQNECALMTWLDASEYFLQEQSRSLCYVC
ncbi:hypothetical protein PIB30_094797 [Stylosanthes scabra]|uniref:Retrotransposon Copia-like N-terminal domain-containing protein n=1 Tax=Stylosanthes scabra TaxID=79078 RepID=A0ABU6SVY1_9FABA|nr:hypothetical protein [Stylosanthes scabra]